MVQILPSTTTLSSRDDQGAIQRAQDKFLRGQQTVETVAVSARAAVTHINVGVNEIRTLRGGQRGICVAIYFPAQTQEKPFPALNFVLRPPSKYLFQS